MTRSTSASRASRLIGRLIIVALFVAGLGGWYWQTQTLAAHERPGGYVVALNAPPAGGGGFFAQTLTTVRTLPAGRTFTAPDSASVRLIYPDGRREDLHGKTRLRLPLTATKGEVMDNFLAVSLRDLASITPAGTHAAAGDVRILSPVAVTRFTKPTISWAARPETDYDVAIIDPADPMAPPRVAEKVRPPLTLDQLKSPQKRGLQPDRLYEVHVRETGSSLMLGATRILVAKDATDGALPIGWADLVAEAVDAMAKKPTRTGDAWLALSQLPADWWDTELVVRLRLRVTADLGLMNEFVRAQEAAWRLAKK